MSFYEVDVPNKTHAY